MLHGVRKSHLVSMALCVLILSVLSSVTLAQEGGDGGFIVPDPDRPDRVRLRWVDHEPLGGRTRVYTRNHSKYILMKNYLDKNYQNRYLDRPLFFDRSLLVTDTSGKIDRNERGYMVDVKTAARFGLDGFRRDKLSRKETDVDAGILERSGLEGFQLVPELCLNPRLLREQGLRHGEGIRNLMTADAPGIRRLHESGLSWKVGGKTVLTTYHADQATPEQLAAALEALREKTGDIFLFVVDYGGERSSDLKTFHANGNAMPRELIEKRRARLREYLDVADGVMFSAAHHLPRPDRRFYEAYYRDYYIPMVAGVLAEPAYRDKLFGLSAGVGYINNFSGSTKLESGTRYLRKSLALAFKARPDFIVLPEWHEMNENNAIRPSIYNGQSSLRIIRRFIDRAAGKKPTPLAGDDTAIPNLVISSRKVLRMGETLEVEVLNIPDGTAPDRYTIDLDLIDAEGKVVHDFEPARLEGAELSDRVFTVASERLADCSAIRPRLTVTRPDGRRQVFHEGLPHIRLRPTWCVSYKNVKVPLRELCKPEEASFETTGVTEEGGRTRIGVSGVFACDEPIMSCMVLEDEEEVYAVDPTGEYAVPEGAEIFRLCWNGAESNPIRGTAEVRGGRLLAHGAIHRKWLNHYPLVDGVIRIDFRCNNHEKGLYLVVADPEQATVRIDTNLFKEEFALKDVLADEVLARAHDGNRVVRIERFNRLPDLPMPIGKKRVAFETTVTPSTPAAVYHMQVVTESGKIYRSRPVVALRVAEGATPDGADGGKVTLPVFSETAGKPVTVRVDAKRVPDMRWEFSPRQGDWMDCSWGRPFDASLGGGFAYAVPFARGRKLPKDSVNAAPDWRKEDGRWSLVFNGRDRYFWLPKEALPTGAFTLTMEIKPTGRGRRVLLQSGNTHPGFLMIAIDDGRLTGTYQAFDDEKHGGRTFVLDPKLDLPIGKWSTLEIRYDLDRMTFRVNGRQGEPIEIGLPAEIFSDLIVGGHLGLKDTDFFKGAVRALRIRHNSR